MKRTHLGFYEFLHCWGSLLAHFADTEWGSLHTTMAAIVTLIVVFLSTKYCWISDRGRHYCAHFTENKTKPKQNRTSSFWEFHIIRRVATGTETFFFYITQFTLFPSLHYPAFLHPGRYKLKTEGPSSVLMKMWTQNKPGIIHPSSGHKRLTEK